MMYKNNFLFYLSFGVLVLGYTIGFGFPKKEKGVVESQPNGGLAEETEDFSGRWMDNSRVYRLPTRETVAEYVYEVRLLQEGNKLTGWHCFTVNNALRTDCQYDGEETIEGKVEGKKADIILRSSFSERPIRATLEKKWTPTGESVLLVFGATNDVVPFYLDLPRAMDEKYLVGIWHGSPSMGSGWSDHYNFYPDGRYNYYYNSMDCSKRKLMTGGNWELNGDELSVTPTDEIVLVGGKLVEASGSCGTPKDLEGAREVQREIIPTKPTKYKLSILPKNEIFLHVGLNMAGNMAVGATFWKFGDDPTGWDNEFPER